MYGTQQPPPPPDGPMGGPLTNGMGGGRMTSSSPIPQKWWDQDAGAIPMQQQSQQQQYPHQHRPPTQNQTLQPSPPLQQQSQQPPPQPLQSQAQQNVRSVTPSMTNHPVGARSPSPYTAGSVGVPPPSPGPPPTPGSQYSAYSNPAGQAAPQYRTAAPSPTPSINANVRASSPAPGRFNAAPSPVPATGATPSAAAPSLYGTSYAPNTYGNPNRNGGPGLAAGPTQSAAGRASPLPVHSAAGRASPLPGHGAAAAPATPASAAQTSAPAGPPRPPSSTGLIRLTLRKPMGIVFEPMTDPHNSAQQRGVRICDLPRTGAAALSRKLEVGDELLSINDKTMSRLTFDEIMDFIIEADAERVNLLFRRPRKESLMIKKPLGAPDTLNNSPSGSNNPSVKWMDESEAASQSSSKKEKKKSSRHGHGSSGDQDRDRDRDRDIGKSSSRDKEKNRDNFKKESSSRKHHRSRRDEVSVVSGESSKYTRESTVPSGREDNRGSSRRRSKNRSLGSRRLLNSENFLDLLIDSVCAPLLQSDSCQRSEKGKNRHLNGREHDYYSDEDDDRTFDSAGDSTYMTYEDAISVDAGKNKVRKDDSQKKGEKDKRSKRSSQYDESCDGNGTRTYGEDENMLPNDTVTDTDNHNRRHGNSDNRNMASDLQNWKMGKSGRGGVDILSPPQEADEDIPEGNYEDDATLETVETLERAKEASNAVVAGASVSSPPLGLAPQSQSNNKMGEGGNSGIGKGVSSQNPSSRNKSPLGMQNARDLAPDQQKHIQDPQLSYDADTNLPISELEYDDRVDADVSVMESLGGPSLLIEAQRHNAAVAAGAAAAATGSPTSRPSVSPEIIAMYGREYPQEVGYTLEETVNRYPDKFYSFVVRSLLEQNEPEKVRLLDKLLDKYSGREPHLIEKLAVRYKKQQMQANGGCAISINKMSNNNAGRATPPTIDEGNEEDHYKNDVPEQREAANSHELPILAGRKNFENSNSSGDDGWPPPMEGGKRGKSPDFENSPHDKSEGKNATRGTLKPESDDELEDDRTEGDETASYTDSEYSGDSIDGTSPAVIAQVSELLNYVYGKTSVPGQIDRVSTIMRAYEGREAVLLELLETKALIKANAENEAANNLPASLRNSPALAASRQQMEQGQQQQQSSPSQQRQPQQQQQQEQHLESSIASSPVSGLTTTNSPSNAEDGVGSSGTKTDDVSSLSGTEFNIKRASPKSDAVQTEGKLVSLASGKSQNERIVSVGSSGSDVDSHRRKKSWFSFRGKKGKKSGGAFPTSSDGTSSLKSGKNRSIISPRKGRKNGSINRVGSTEGSI